MRFRVGLLTEVLVMAVETLRSNKMRSALTVLGVVIGVTSIVGMTSLIRGFGDQMETLINQMGANTVYVAKMSIASFASGKKFVDMLRRPNITEEDARAIKSGSPAAMMVGWQLGNGPGSDPQRISYHDISTKLIPVIGASANFADINYIGMDAGRFFSPFEEDHRRNVIVLSYGRRDAVPCGHPLRQACPLNGKKVHGRRRDGQRPSPLGGDRTPCVIRRRRMTRSLRCRSQCTGGSLGSVVGYPTAHERSAESGRGCAAGTG